MQIINPTYAPIILTDLIYAIHFSFYHSNPLSSILLEVTAPFNSILLTVAITRCLIAKFKTQIPPPKPSLNSLLQQTFSEIKFAHFNLYLTIYQFIIYILPCTLKYILLHHFLYFSNGLNTSSAGHLMTDLTDLRQVETTSE